MKLGLLSDIHEDVPRLTQALQLLKREQVDQIVFLGDVLDTGQQLATTCRLLHEAAVVGVWGNHDLGFCHQPDPALLAHYPAAACDFLRSLLPHVELGECRFAHVEPWLDPCDPGDINFYEGPPDSSERRARIFAAAPQRFLFSGHLHRWRIVTPERTLEWAGESPVRLAPGRFFVVVGALCEGHCGVFDTVTTDLTPLRLPS